MEESQLIEVFPMPDSIQSVDPTPVPPQQSCSSGRVSGVPEEHRLSDGSPLVLTQPALPVIQQPEVSTTERVDEADSTGTTSGEMGQRTEGGSTGVMTSPNLPSAHNLSSPEQSSGQSAPVVSSVVSTPPRPALSEQHGPVLQLHTALKKFLASEDAINALSNGFKEWKGKDANVWAAWKAMVNEEKGIPNFAGRSDNLLAELVITAGFAIPVADICTSSTFRPLR